MPRGSKPSNKLSDKYLQFFLVKETVAAAATLQTFTQDTGMTARGGWIWEVYSVEFSFYVDPAVVASGGMGTQTIAVSMLGTLTAQPTIGDYGCLYVRTVYRIGNGTQNLHYWSFPPEILHNFTKPILYAKPSMYIYYQQSVATAGTITGRIGYLTRTVSGPLLWETVEQFMSGGV